MKVQVCLMIEENDDPNNCHVGVQVGSDPVLHLNAEAGAVVVDVPAEEYIAVAKLSNWNVAPPPSGETVTGAMQFNG